MLKVWTNLPEALIPEAVCCGVSEGRRRAPQPKRHLGQRATSWPSLFATKRSLLKAQRDALRSFAESNAERSEHSPRMGLD
jgi:hypothetical protein